MKKLLILKSILLLFLVSNLQADGRIHLDRLYIGGSYSDGSGEIKEEASTTTTADFDLTSRAFKIGYILENEDRVVFSYESLTKKLEPGVTWFSKTQPEITGINVDAVLTILASKSFIPYLSIGIGNYSLEDSAKYFTGEYDLTGTSLNGAIGFFLNMGVLEFEVSYSMKELVWAEIESSDSSMISTTSSFSYITMGVNIHF